MTYYNPFGKEISVLEKEDLDSLIGNVAEGWYVEYKSTFPSSNQKIAHSIASFANTEGGWYIVGIVGETNTNLATEISPFDLSRYNQPKDKIRNIVTNSINPVPFFESKLINIPDNEGVLVVYIAKGEETPYVTNDGRIYERVGEGSDPIYLKDHYSLQKLFERSKEANMLIENFSTNLFLKSSAQDQKQCFLEVYFYIPPSYMFEFKNFHIEFFDEMRENFSTNVRLIKEIDVSMTLNFNNFYSTTSSYILRYIEESFDPLALGLTLELFNDGNMKLILPLNEMNLLDTEHIPHAYKDSDILTEFFGVLIDSEINIEALTIIDGFASILIFIVIFNQYCRLLRNHNFEGSLKTRFKLLNSDRVILYYDDKEYINFIKENGLPLSLKSIIEIPPFSNGNALLYNLDYNTNIMMFRFISEALGIPINYLAKFLTSGFGNYLIKNSKVVSEDD